MNNWVLILLFFSFTAVFAQDGRTGMYTCCRNSFILKLLPGQRFEVVETAFGPDDRDTGGKMVKGSVFVANLEYRLEPDSIISVKEIENNKSKKTIKVNIPVSPEEYIYLKTDLDGTLYWKRGDEWQKLYQQPEDEE